jgi:hypothetical protein
MGMYENGEHTAMLLQCSLRKWYDGKPWVLGLQKPNFQEHTQDDWTPKFGQFLITDPFTIASCESQYHIAD